MKIPFHKPFVPNSFSTIFPKSIKDGWLTTGPEVKNFENKLSQYNNSKYAIAVNSCTAALHLALAAKNFGIGDKFIAPTYTFVASIEVGEYLGMEPVLIDCDENYNINIDQIEQKLKKDPKIKAVIPVHFAGKAVDMERIFLLANEYNLFVLEDAAHALETKSNYGKVGNTNHAAAFSFYANKNITTGGEGGAICTNNKPLSDKIRKLSLHGMSKDGWSRFKPGAKWYYDVSMLGYKYNMTDISASLGLWQLEQVNNWLEKRKSLVRSYVEGLKDIDGIVCPNINNTLDIQAHHLFIIRLKSSRWKIDRDNLIDLLNKNGIGTSVHYKPVHMHSYYAEKYNYKPSDFPNAENYFNKVITLPLYPLLKTEEIDYIIQFLNEMWIQHKL